jgi:glutamine amidotransferase
MDNALLIDAGTGNLHSVYNALSSLGYTIRVTSVPADLARPGRIILPGVGAFGKFMEGVAQRGLAESLRTAAERGDPLLGICVGMQAIFEVGEELGQYSGLGLLPGRVIRFPEAPGLKIPHTGWNQLWPAFPCPLFKNISAGSYVYFNHSYYCAPGNPSDVAATTDYGLSFASVVQRGNWFGVQFHPEKSQQVGLQLLKNFMEL